MPVFTCPFCGTTLTLPRSRLVLYRTCGQPSCRKRYRREVGHGNAGQKRPATTGPNNPMWRGGVSKLRQGYRGGDAYAEWRRGVLERSGHACAQCGSTDNVIAHHIQGWHEAPRLRHNPENGIALCRKCHAHAHKLIQNLPGPWPERPSVSTILCRYCGEPRAVPTKAVKRYSTCGRSECVRKRIIDGISKKNRFGNGNSRYRDGRWTTTDKVCAICFAHFIGPSKRTYCSHLCATIGRRKKSTSD